MLPAFLVAVPLVAPAPQEPQPAAQHTPWLIAHQDEDGRWDADGFPKHDDEDADEPSPAIQGAAQDDIAVTSLALLSLVGDGHTLKHGPYQDSVVRAVSWLVGEVDPATGLVGLVEHDGRLRDHALATLALCEVQYFSKDLQLKRTCRRAVLALEARREEWTSDTMTAGWTFLALQSADEAGVAVDPASRPAAIECIVGARDADADADARVSAMGILCRLLAGHSAEEYPELAADADALLASRPTPGTPLDYEAYFLTTLVAYRLGAEPWKSWNRSMRDVLLVRGYPTSEPADASLCPRGTVAAEAYRVLATEVYFRYSMFVAAR